MINLDHRGDRWQRQLAQAQRFGLTLERVPAERHPVGWVGCALSHQKVLRAAQARGDSWVLIVEDDIVLAEDFVPHWQAVYQWLTAHEDQWEVFLGGYCLYRPAQGPVLARRCGLMRLQGTTCAHFGLIHQRAYERLLAADFRVFQEPGATCQRTSHWEVQAGDGRRFAPYDNYFQITGCRVVGCYPMLAGQEAGVSDIEGHVMNYDPFFAATGEHLKGLGLEGQPPRCCLWDFWSDRRTVTDFWNRCGPTGRHIQWVGPEEDPDYHIVINRPGHGQAHLLTEPGRTIAITMEPYWINELWRDSQTPPLLAAVAHERYPNLWEWHIGLSAAELADPATCQKREPIAGLIDLSTVVSSKYFYPGHRLRVDFLRYVEAQGLAVDIYGSSNDHGFRQYRGPLPDKRKAPGLCPYRYTVAVENMSHPRYCTEKVIDGILGECLTFYWGDPTIAARFPGATVWLPLERSFEEALQIIRQHMVEGAWERQLPAIQAAKKTVLEQGGCNAQIATIIRDLTTPRAASVPGRRPLTVMIGAGNGETVHPLGPTMTLWRNWYHHQLRDDAEFYLQRCCVISGGWEGFYRQLITEIPLGHWVLWVPTGAPLEPCARWQLFEEASAYALDVAQAILVQHSVATEKWVRTQTGNDRQDECAGTRMACAVRGVLLAPLKDGMPNFWQYDGAHMLEEAEAALAAGAGVVKIWIPDTQRCFHPELHQRCQEDPRLELWTWSCLERREYLVQILHELWETGWQT